MQPLRAFAEPTITVCLIATLYAAYAAATTRRPAWHVATGLAFGAAVAIDAATNMVAVGAPMRPCADASQSACGAVYLFTDIVAAPNAPRACHLPEPPASFYEPADDEPGDGASAGNPT